MKKECRQAILKKEIAESPKDKPIFEGAVIGKQYMYPHVQRFPLTELGKANHILTRRS